MTFDEELIWREAKALSKNAAAIEVINRVEQNAVREWSTSAPDQQDAREAAYGMVRAIRAFRDELAALASSQDVTAFNRRLNTGRQGSKT